jgi:hypothetical protein
VTFAIAALILSSIGVLNPPSAWTISAAAYEFSYEKTPTPADIPKASPIVLPIARVLRAHGDFSFG